MTDDYQRAVRLLRAGDWEEAHNLVQSSRNPLACWIHAWLHRQEGDTGNARYWYDRAGREYPDCSLDEELAQIAQATAE